MTNRKLQKISRNANRRFGVCRNDDGRLYVEKYWKQFQNCLQYEKPFCSNVCPFHVDVLDFQAKMARKNYSAAYKTFRNAVGFPDIVAALCPEYCASVCPRKDSDKAVQLNLLEKTCVSRVTKKDPPDYNVPKKEKKIGIIGAGISGLACAVRLTQKKYDVTIYEKTDRLGGKLWDLLPPEIFLEDIRRQLQFEKYALHFNTEIKDIAEISGERFDAVYIATGENGRDFGIMGRENGHCVIDGNTAILAGGSMTGKDPMRALADGLDMASAIEVYFMTGRLEYPKAWESCKIDLDPEKLIRTEGIVPAENGIFNDAEAVAEAERCIRCQCDGCMKYSDMFGYYKKWPLKVREELMCTLSASESMGHRTPATRIINTCTQCGLCDEVCTGKIELAEMMRDARRKLHKLGKMPGAFHQFWINDMKFTNGRFAAVTKKAPGQDQCAYAFFPGCQIGAADPRYVSETYKWLLSKKSDTGLLLRCCSVPAEWAGNEKMHKSEIAALRKEWEKLGSPILIVACPACDKHLKEYLPDIKTVSLYEVLDQWGGEWPVTERGKVYSVFDPCTARNIRPVENAVRSLAAKTGVSLEELPMGDKHGCCGYGGNISIADPDYAAYIARSRSELSGNPYIAYCANCRDAFIGDGKPVRHILDLLFGINSGEVTLPDVTERRRNRVDLKETLLKEIWGEKMEAKPAKNKFALIISPELREKMNKSKILEEDICEVIELGETGERRTFDRKKGTYLCYRELGYITCWVEYRPKGEAYEIVNVYSHRMKIVLEEMWNGRKTDTDLR